MAAFFLLEELLSSDGSVCQWVDSINHEVGLGVIFKLHSITVAIGSDSFNDNFSSWDLILDVPLQYAGKKKKSVFRANFQNTDE